jgi:hypothetical protein
MPQLIYECEYHADLYLREIGNGPLGHRVYAGVTGGTVQGDRITGGLAPVGGDWLIIAPDGFGQIDVIIQILTNDGAPIHVSYKGLLQLTPAVQALLGGGDQPTGYGDQYFFTACAWRRATSATLGEPDGLRRAGPRAPRPVGGVQGLPSCQLKRQRVGDRCTIRT